MAIKLFGITGTIHFFMVAPGDFRHSLQVLGEWQVFQHDNGLDNMVIDLKTLLGG